MENSELLQSLINDMARIKTIQDGLRRQITEAADKLKRLIEASKTANMPCDLDNAERIMNVIKDAPGISKTKILQALQWHMNATAITIALRFLIESGMIEEEVQRKSPKGRPSACYRSVTP